jgi:ubiquinone/menaquinone biosynthesis C-methylase UbiE
MNVSTSGGLLSHREILSEHIMSERNRYIPALSFRWLTPLYDPLLRWGMREETFKRRLITQANIQPGQRVLDLGCGTGTLTILVKLLYPDANVVGLDGDPQVLEIANSKAVKAGVEITLDQGMAYRLPYPDSSFDRVLSSLVVHHLAREDKQRMMIEIGRCLRPAGELHIVDFGKPRGVYGTLASHVIRRLERANDNIAGLLPEMMRAAGLGNVDESGCLTTIFGTLSLYQGSKPGSKSWD